MVKYFIIAINQNNNNPWIHELRFWSNARNHYDYVFLNEDRDTVIIQITGMIIQNQQEVPMTPEITQYINKRISAFFD